MFEKFEVEFVVCVMGVFGTRNGQMTNLIGAMGECQSEIKVSASFFRHLQLNGLVQDGRK